MARRQATVSVRELEAYLGSGYKVLRDLGYDHIPTDHNPIWLALAAKDPFPPELIEEMIESGQIEPEEAALLTQAADEGAELADKLELWKGATPNKGAILQAYVLCQTAFLDTQNGPIRDGSLGTLRQRWYFSKSHKGMGFKLAAQTLERALIKSADIVLVDGDRSWRRAEREKAQRVEFKTSFGKAEKKALQEELGRPPRVHTWPKKGWGHAYAQQHSGILSRLVHTGLTYEQLWVRDASRDYATAAPLVPGLNGLLIIEKQGLFEHFTPIARALGFPILLAMSGNNAFSGVESLITDNLREWDGTSKVTAEKPLHIFSITDHDYYGLVPVQEGAVTQFSRYFGENVVVHRVGISPEQVRKLGHSPILMGYEVEADYNQSTWDWYVENGIWIGTVGDPDARCYGMEVEALEPREYIPALIEAIVEACGGDEEIRKKLAKLAEPEWYDVEHTIERDEYNALRLWRLLSTLRGWAERLQGEAERPVNRFVHDRINKASYWQCKCGYKSQTDPATLKLCPACHERYTWEATNEYDYDADRYRSTCPCGHEYEGEPDDQYKCPECGEDLEYSTEPKEPWKEQGHVRETISEIIAEHEESIDFGDYAKHAQDNGYSVWRPVGPQEANQVAYELFKEEFEDHLEALAQEIDREKDDLIHDLEYAYNDLRNWDLLDPDN